MPEIISSSDVDSLKKEITILKKQVEGLSDIKEEIKKLENRIDDNKTSSKSVNNYRIEIGQFELEEKYPKEIKNLESIIEPWDVKNINIRFKNKFSKEPKIMLSVVCAWQEKTGFNISAENISENGFILSIQALEYDIYDFAIQWIAIGE